MHSGAEKTDASQVTQSNMRSCELDPERDYTLNLIFHGPFCFIRYDDHIEAITPAAMGHVYGIGTFRKEYSMSSGVYYLVEGVDEVNDPPLLGH